MALQSLKGIKFSKLLVKERSSNLKDGSATWLCICDCGNERIIAGTALRAGRNKSCGCASPRFTTERVVKHGKSQSRVYRIWNGMKKRCSENSFGKSRKLYYLKGIKVCDRWQNFELFYEDMGDPPDSYSIDRIDGNGNYEPSNCRWASAKEQANNTFKNKKIEFDGEIKTISQWAEHLNIKPNTLLYRLRRNWSIERAFKK
jgi:hypothetical protein